MTFELASPSVLAAIPVVLTVLLLVHRRRPRAIALDVASLLPWESVETDAVAIRRAQRTLSARFWLQLLALTLLVVGLAGPRTVRHVGSGRRLLVVLDASASMQASHGDTTRFERARAEADRLFAALGPSDRGMLVAFSSRPWVVQGWTADHDVLRRAATTLAPHDTPTALAAALAMARGLLREVRDDAEVVVISDRPVAEVRWDAPVALRAVRVAGPAENAAITDVEVVQGPFTSVEDTAVYVTVWNFGASAREVRLVARLDGEVIGRWQERLDAGGSQVFVQRGVPRSGHVDFELEGREGAESRVRNDGLALDDRASVWIRPRAPIRTRVFSEDPALVATLARVAAAGDAIRLVGSPAEATGGGGSGGGGRSTGSGQGGRADGREAHALASGPQPDRNAAPIPSTAGRDGSRRDGADDGARSGDDPEDDAVLAVFHRISTSSGGWTGPALVIAPPEDDPRFSVGGTIEAIRTIDWDPATPLGRHLQFPLAGETLVARRVLPRFPARPAVQVATEAGDVPVVWAGTDGGRRIVTFGFDLAPLDLTRDENLPVLVLLLNAWLDPIAGHQPRLVRTGQPPPTVDGDGPLADETAGAPVPFARAGEHVVTTAHGERRYLAQLLDVDESRIWEPEPPRAAHADPAPASRPARSIPDAPERRPLAPYLYVAALPLLAGEWILYRRAR
jgi:hypothetical protein